MRPLPTTILLTIMLSAFIVTGCLNNSSVDTLSQENIRKVINTGDFRIATNLIRTKLAVEELSPDETWEWNYEIDRMERIKKDFSLNQDNVYTKIREYYPGITDAELKRWEESNAIENMIIDGEKRYFYAAARNLFRIEKEAQQKYEKIKGRQSDSLDRFLAWYIPSIVKEAKRTKSALVKPVRMKIRYTLTVKPDEVPADEIVRVWMPYPRPDAKHRNIKLLSTSQPDYIIAPDQYEHKSIYMEQKVKKGKPAIFSYELSYTSYNQWFNFFPEDVKPYDKNSDLYKKYTAERNTHVIFTDDIRRLTDSLVGTEQNPYLKAKKIYSYICDNYPWASAREYSTIRNIPQYSIDNKHGDCGQVSLLFITMARYAGIPAKWQSGWMMHPGNLNLHDWAEAYFEGIGWVPVDQSFGKVYLASEDEDALYFYTKGLDAYRLIVNDDFSGDMYPAKIHPRSETVDFQRGEVEWRGENLYFGRWRYKMDVEYL